MDWETRYKELTKETGFDDKIEKYHQDYPSSATADWEVRYMRALDNDAAVAEEERIAQVKKSINNAHAAAVNRNTRQTETAQNNAAANNSIKINALGAGNYGADKQPNAGYSYGKGIAKAGLSGLSNIAQMVSTPLSQGEQLAGKAIEFVTGKEPGKGLFERWDDSIKAEQQAVEEKYRENTEKGGEYAAKLEGLEQSVFEALPSLGVALATGGASTAASAADMAAQTAGKTGLAATAKQGAKALLKDPNFITSALQIYSGSYNNAKAEGASEPQATAYALANAGLGGYVEIQGGLQKLPKVLQGDETFLKALAKTMLEEGTEEVEQGVIDRALQRIGYGADNPLLGFGENGIIDPVAAAEEFAGGAIVGGLLGGGTMAVGNALNKAYNRTAQTETEAEAEQPTAQLLSDLIGQDTHAVTAPQQASAQNAAETPVVQFEDVGTQTYTPTRQNVTTERTSGKTKGFGENGQAAYANVQSEYGSDSKTYQGFAVAYNAGLSGVSPSLVQANVPDAVRSAAYQAGLDDRTANLRKTNEAVKRVTVDKGAGLLRNDYARKLTETHSDIADTLNTIGAGMGVQIEIVDSVLGGAANGQYDRSARKIYLAMDAENPVMTVTAHEVTHRIQDLAPEEYAAYQQAAAEYYVKEYGADSVTALTEAYKQVAQENGMELSNEEALDEMAADFTELLLNDADLFKRFAKDNRTAAQRLLDALKEFIAKIKSKLTGKARNAAAQNAYGKSFNELEQIAQKWQTAYDAAAKQAKAAENTNTATETGSGAKYSIRSITSDSGEQYGIGVYLDSPLLENLTDAERVQMVKERIRELGGQTFVAYDNNGNAVNVRVAEPGERFTNKSGKSVSVNKDLVTKNRNVGIKQEAVVLVDEMIATATYDGSKRAAYPHGWLDNYGKNDWQYWDTYIQDKENAVWKATLNIAESKNGTYTLYEVNPIKMVEQPVYSGTSTTNASVAQGGKNVKEKFSLKSKDKPYLSAVQSGDTAAAQALVNEAAKAAGYTIRAYHGTARADRVGTVFRPDRATSGPMAFFTSSKEIAENYARDKADTSIAYDTEYDDYYTQFRVTRNSKSLSVGELWNRLTPTERAKIKEAAPHIRFDEDYDQIIYDPAAQHGNGAYDAYELNRNKGNALNALVSTWLETGDLYGREGDFLDVLKLAGVKDAEYRNPDARNEKVYDTYLKIQNPFDTETVDEAFYNDLSAWLDGTDIDEYRKETSGADMWDKNSATPERFLERLSEDIEKGTTHAWTSIPDYVTAYLQERGYDGIKDTGGKGGGESHTVWIPFSSEQVKSAEPVVYDDSGDVVPLSERFDDSKTDIRYSWKGISEYEQELRGLKKEWTRLAARNRELERRVQELKGEMRLSKEPAVVAKDVKKLGKSIISQYDSGAKYSDIEESMDALAKAVMKKDVSMSDLMPHAKAAAEVIIDNASQMIETGAELLEIRGFLRQQNIRFDGEKMANYNDFRKSHMGALRMSKNGVRNVDDLYAELTDTFGEGYFPSDIYNEVDELRRIGDVLDGIKDIYENPYAPYYDVAVQEVANELVDGIISDRVRQKHTFADKQERKKQEAVGRVQKQLEKERQRREKQVERLRRSYAEKTRKGIEKRNATALRAKIARHTADLSRKLLRPTDKQHIPEVLRKPVAELLHSINLESAHTYDENGKRKKNQDGDPTQRTLNAIKLRHAYSEVMRGDDAISVDPALLEQGGLLDTLEQLSDKRVAQMNMEELKTVWEAIRAIEGSVSSYNKSLSSAKYAKISDWAERFKEDSSTRKRRNRKITLDMANPYTFFSAYGDAGMEVYHALTGAEALEHKRVKALGKEVQKFFSEDVYKQRYDRHEYTTERGEKLTLTTEQLMNLYNLARRGEQSMNHLMAGGIVQPEIARNEGQPAVVRGEENIPLTESDLKSLIGMLTPEQRKVADGFQKVASTMLAEWGNEASMQVYGYRKFTEENYWPIQTAKEANVNNAEKDNNNFREIKNMGSAKALTPNATNALDIGGIYDVFTKNASDMVKYSTLLAPVEDINRLFNYRYRNNEGGLTGRNLRQVLSSVYGDEAQKYWLNLLRDMQNGIRKSGSATTRAIEEVVGNAKAAAVGANARTVIQQPTAIGRAAVILGVDDMVKGMKGGATEGNGWEKAKKYAAIADIKDTGGFDQGGQFTIARELYGSQGALEKLNDIASWGAAKADAVTWGKIWNACEWQAASDTNLTKGSEAFYEEVARVFTDVIDQTQVVDGIMQRTQIMRDGDALTRQATAFMGEPLKALNMLMRSYDAWAYETDTEKRSAALKQLKRTVAAVAVTDVINALAQSIVDGIRDDDKDEKYLERVLGAFTGYDKDSDSNVRNVLLGGNIASNINPLSRLPYAKDALSIMQGYTVDRMDAGAFEDLYNAAEAFINASEGKGKKTVAYTAKQLISATAKVFGVSVTNFGRDLWGVARSIAIETGSVRVMYEMERAIYRMDKSASNGSRWCELLHMAQTDGDSKTAKLIYKDMLSHGYDEDYVKQGVEKIMKKEQGVSSVNDLKSRWKAPS